MTWNIQTARPNPDGPADIEAVADSLRTLDADVHALQELDRDRARSGRTDQPARLADALGGELTWVPTLRWGRGEYGIGLVVRGQVRSTEVVALGGTREPRALLVAELDVGGGLWTVGCTHLSRDRRCATRQLLRVFDALGRRPRPRLLLGDLNLIPGEVLPWSTAEGFHLVDGPPTHSTRQRRLTRRVDHLLVAGATVDSAAVHTFPASDHRAVSAELTHANRGAKQGQGPPTSHPGSGGAT